MAETNSQPRKRLVRVGHLETQSEHSSIKDIPPWMPMIEILRHKLRVRPIYFQKITPIQLH